MQHDVCAVRCRTKERRREERVVDHEDEIVLVGDSGQRGNIAHPEEWVRERLDVDGARLRRNGCPESICIGKIDEGRRAA